MQAGSVDAFAMLSTREAARLLLDAGEPEEVAVAELMDLRSVSRADAEMTVRVVAREVAGTRRPRRTNRPAPTRATAPASARRDRQGGVTPGRFVLRLL